MDEVDNSIFHIPTSSLVSDVAVEYTSTPSQATVAPSNIKQAQTTAVSPASIDVSPKNPQTATINSVSVPSLDYTTIYDELSSASEEIITCRNSRLSSAF